MINSTFIHAETIVSDKIESILPLIQEDTLVLLNASDVMYQHTSSLADVTWREYFAGRVKAIVSDPKTADKIINQVRGVLVTKLPQKNVEDITPALIKKLQEDRVPVLGITQKRVTTPYAKDFAGITNGYLTKLGINLEETLSYSQLPKESKNDNYTFIHGSIFTNKKPVGPAIVSFLEDNQYFPKRVVMVDNDQACLEDAERALLQRNIEFKGLEYTATSTYKKSVDITLATIEFFELIYNEEVLSDDQAKEVLESNPSINFAHLLDAYIKEQAEND